jgi:hypothetical protein
MESTTHKSTPMTNTNEFDSAQWVEFSSMEGKNSSASLFLPIEHYCVIADRVFISFLKAYRRLYVEGDDSMAQRVSVLGKRLSDFIKVVLPSHPDYNVEAKERANDIYAQLQSYLKRFEENHEYDEEEDECRVCCEEVRSCESESRDVSESAFENSSDTWINSPSENVLLKYVDIDFDGSTDNSSVSSTSIAGSFLSNISSVIFEQNNLSIDEHEDPSHKEEAYVDQTDKTILDAGKVIIIDEVDEVFNEDNLEPYPEHDDSSIDKVYDINNDIDYSFQSLLSHWKMHELRHIKKSENN